MTILYLILLIAAVGVALYIMGKKKGSAGKPPSPPSTPVPPIPPQTM